MADPHDRWEDNTGGEAVIGGRRYSFYVDRECILCSVCTDLAPRNFRESDDGDHDVCSKQPEDEAELEQCLEAVRQCPVEAIGTDGWISPRRG